METTKQRQNKKSKNKEKKNIFHPTTFSSWDHRVFILRWQNQAAMSRENPPKTAKHQKSVKAKTQEAQRRDETHLTKKDQAEKEDLNCKQADAVPNCHILQKQPEDVPKHGPKNKDAPQIAATSLSAPQPAATPDGLPQQAGRSSGATQQAREATKFTRGPVQRKHHWTPPPPYRTPVTQYSGEVKALYFKRGPVQHKRFWTAPRYYTPQRAPAKPQHAGRVNACDRVEASPQQARIHVPQLQLQQLQEREKTTDLKMKNDGLAALLEQFRKKQGEACDGVEAFPQQASIYISELELQQLRNRKTEQHTKLMRENEALAVGIEQLKEVLKTNKAVIDDAVLKRGNVTKDLEVQLSEKKASEDEALCKLQQTEEALQSQKESEKAQQMCLAKVKEENNKLMIALVHKQSELETQQVQWQEERSRLFQSLSEIQHTLQEEEKTWETRQAGLMDRIINLEEQMKKTAKKPKKPSLWKRFRRLFK